jgi:hypothetical protein
MAFRSQTDDLLHSLESKTDIPYRPVTTVEAGNLARPEYIRRVVFASAPSIDSCRTV